MDTISTSEVQTLPGLLQCRIKKSPDRTAYQQYDHDQLKWTSYTWSDIGKIVSSYQQALQQELFEKGDRVAILHKNSIEWVAFEQAALALGLIVVPLYSWDNTENIAYILKNSGSRLLFCQKAETYRRLLPYAAKLTELTTLICLEEIRPITKPLLSLVPSSKWLDNTQRWSFEKIDLEPDSPATIVYTSGTTGKPKGVILSHRNILWNAEAVLKVVPCFPSDMFLSFLPLSHTFERTVGYYLPMMGGAAVTYARSINKLQEDLLTVRPTVIISVPRIYEKIYSKIHQQIKEKPAFAQKLFNAAVNIGRKFFLKKQGRKTTITLTERLAWPLLKKLVADKVLCQLGGRIRVAVSGGAPLHESVSKLFLGLGLPLLQGYGLTEASPVVSTNRLTDNVPTSVGPPLPDVDLKIVKGNELLIKSPGVMPGYWSHDKQSDKIIDSDGWLHTGDVVEIQDNRIYIRGRLKEIIVTSTAEKVAPVDLELTVTNDDLFDNAIVVGEGKPFIAALVVLNRDRWTAISRKLNVTADDMLALESREAKQLVLDRIEKLLHSYPVYAQIRAVSLMFDEWNIENGLLTPTLKLKRQIIADRYSKEIAALYKGHELHHDE